MTDFSLPIHVDRYGDTGPALVMLHGFAATNINWRRWRAELAKHFQVHEIELKGHGRASAPPDGRYSAKDNAALVVEYIRSVEAEDVVLVGHSMGGGVALLAALTLLEDDPGLLRAMVSMAGAAYPQPLPPFIAFARKKFIARLLFRVLPKRLLIKIILRHIVVDSNVIDQAQIDGYALPLMRRPTWEAILETASQLIPPDMIELCDRFPEIDVPVLALWGRHDRVVPLSVGERLAAELPDTRLVVLEDCGHIPTEEKPEESLEAVLGFLQEIGLS